ncbi:DUF4261 domain-containing protein [Niastella caeni]|uniref:DUF4261 domain-containing protein n=1 Tax=Niastella caeni TaxID=2569763 RepID=A0A4S8HSL9_9BACT|nr:DUF4261 domain-containing protein [Niastella caeni]
MGQQATKVFGRYVHLFNKRILYIQRRARSDVNFKDGETIGYTEDQKIKITSSKGVFVDGESFKLEM